MKRLWLALFATTLCSPALAQAPQGFGTLNSSAAITAGNTFQQLLAANAKRRSLTIQNNNASDSCWIFIGPTASATKATSMLLFPGGSYNRYYPYIPIG